MVYCADAFDGLKAIREFEAGKLVSTSWEEKGVRANRPSPQREVLSRSAEPPAVPFVGHKLVTDIDVEKLYGYLNEAALFRGRWGYRRGKTSKEEYAELHENTVLPLFQRLKEQALNEGWLQPKVT